jgi:integrase
VIAQLSANVRESFGALGLGDGMAATSRALRGYQFSTWERLTPDPVIGEVTTKTLVKFQLKALKHGLAPETIETTINAVYAVLRAGLDSAPKRPKRLTGQPTKSSRLSMAEFNQFLLSLPEGIKGTRGRDLDWWLGWWGLLYFTAFRLADGLAVQREQIGSDGIEVRQTKTGGLVRIPLHGVCKRLLANTGESSGKVFHVSRKTLYRVTERVCKVAGIAALTPQMVRVLAARQYERAHPGSGRLILGRGFPGADRYYFDAGEILQSASEKLDVPDALMTPEEKRDRASAEFQMLAAFRRMKVDQREAVLKIAKSMRAG